ncbi:MAG: hypothetical protein A2138_00660 [Deltaproteobacteria bacterium RBG_16_71_12]|nr:MAG: hypothetical protein A2138_00660 [Deltaproteobacteria bacterium RBG_16_71_12]
MGGVVTCRVSLLAALMLTAACGLLDAGGVFTSPFAIDTDCTQGACACAGDGCACDTDEESCSCRSPDCFTSSAPTGASCGGAGCECDGAACRCTSTDCWVEAAQGADVGCVGIRCACDGDHCICEDETGNACRCGTPGEIFEDPCEGGAEL